MEGASCILKMILEGKRMKWFKHLVDSGDDPDVGYLMSKYGFKGYYMFFRTLEIMSREFDEAKPGENQFAFRWFLQRFHNGIGKKLLLNFLKSASQLERLNYRLIKGHNGGEIWIKFHKLKDLTDDYTARIVRTKSEQNSKFLRSKSEKSSLPKKKKKEVKNNKEINKEIRYQIITYLNEKTRKNFNPDSDVAIESINGRISDGAKWEDFKHVIDVKVQEWLGHPQYDQYLRPSTLFRPSKFEDYQNQRYISSGDMIGQSPEKPKSPEQEKRASLIEKKRSEVIAKHQHDLDNARTPKELEVIQNKIKVEVAAYSHQLRGEL